VFACLANQKILLLAWLAVDFCKKLLFPTHMEKETSQQAFSEKEPSKVIATGSGEMPQSRFMAYIQTLGGIFSNLPTELESFGKIPCAQRSLYTGILAGGLVSAISLVITGIGIIDMGT
jgi:hypothetical protein